MLTRYWNVNARRILCTESKEMRSRLDIDSHNRIASQLRVFAKLVNYI